MKFTEHFQQEGGDVGRGGGGGGDGGEEGETIRIYQYSH